MTPERVCYLNGEVLPLAEAKISVLDRGFIFGDGVYEVIPVYRGAPFRFEAHMQRLDRSLAAIRLANPLAHGEWREVIGSLVRRHDWPDQSVYLEVTRGVAPRDHRFPAATTPTVFVMTGPLSRPSETERREGVAVASREDNRWLRCDVKSVSLLGNVLLRQAAADAGVAEVVLFRDGFLTEASASNVFVVRDGTLLAPPKDNLILAGITYDVVLELAREHGQPVDVRRIAEGEVRGADELWLTSSSKEVLAVATLDGRAVGTGRPGPMFARMAEWFEAAKSKGTADARHL